MELHDAAAIRRVAPEVDPRVRDRFARFGVIDRAAEVAGTRAQHQREGRDRDILREKRQFVRAELVVRRGVEDVVTELEVGGNGERERLLRVVRLEVERLGPLLRGAARCIFIPHRPLGVVVVRVTHGRVLHEVVERDGDEPEVDLVEIPRLDRHLRPRRAPVALHLDRKRLLLDSGDDCLALLRTQRLRPFLRVFDGEVVRGDEVVLVSQNLRLRGRAEGDGLGLALVAREEVVEEGREIGVALLLRLLVEGADEFGAVQLGHCEGVEVAVLLVELNQLVVEGETLFARFVGDVLAVEPDGVADGEVEEGRAVGCGDVAMVEKRNPVQELLRLEVVREGEDLGELRLQRPGDFLRRPRRHLVGGGFVVELRGGRAAPAPAAGVLEVGVGEVELEDGLERRRLGIDRGRKGGQPVRGLFIGELRHRLLAD